MLTTDFDEVIADRICDQHRALAARWFERLLGLLPVEARDIFPTTSLLDHVPALIHEIGAYVRQPEDLAIVANTAILEKARELGGLRHEQRASLHQVLREYQMLGGVLVAFVLEEMVRLELAPTPRESAGLVSRLHEAVNALSQATVETFITLYTDTITEQTQRLESFTRMAAHEWRQPLSTVQFGITLLRHPQLDAPRAHRTWEAVERNVGHLIDVTRKLESIARLQGTQDTPLVQRVSLTAVAQEAARQVFDMAAARDVRVTVAEGMPEVTVDVGRLELSIVNLLSNAIKYADPAKLGREVHVSGVQDADGWCRLAVRDNGLGIPQEALATIFERFTRAHGGRDSLAYVDGLGLGLAIVDDNVRAMGGEVEVQSTEGTGTTFTLRLPLAGLARR
ncbi:HAMP domain-containing sensor histidine kinase [Luteitalea sp.]|uniref:sensor histidine kinase n=1 Tax=Luteitalea sp. TaxID=2004800 RepID=UPI0025BEACA7|nr:HAMP domain-containing sensor histidine kinase [Luteitalea sp.]